MRLINSIACHFQRLQTFVMNRMVPSEVIEKDSLSYWRARILFAFIFTGLLIGFFIFVPLIAMAIKENMWGLLVFDGIVWLIGIGLLMIRGLRYDIRAGVALLMIYFAGLVIIISVGPLSGGPAWLFAFAILVGILLEPKFTFIALILNALTLTAIGWSVNAGLFGQTFPFFNSTERMITAGATFMLLNALTAISVSVLVKGLISVHQKEKDLISSLKREHLRLVEAKNELEFNIEERKQSVEALRESEKKYRLLAENASDVIWTMDMDLNYTYISPAIEKLQGWSVEEAASLTINDILTPQSMEIALKRLDAHMAHGAKTGNYNITDRFELELYRKDGTTIRTEISVTSILGEDGKPVGISGVTRDITERKKLEDQLLQAHKMEAIGTLAGGIAHDFNNILSAIVGYTELALMKPKGLAIQEELREVLIACGRAKDLVKQILTFSRQGGEAENKPIKVKLIVKEALKLLRSSLPSSIEFHENIQSDSLVLADPTQIHQVVMNLCTNAAHAMRETGTLEIGLVDINLDLEFTSEHPEIEPGLFIRLTISDTGHGMTSDVLDRIFDPFFTTKASGEGTGMGLAVVHGIVKSHGGIITVYSEPEKGSIFNVFFPVIQRRDQEDTAVEEILSTGTERILFVDDEPPLVSIGKKILQFLGYQVESRTNSIEALELFKAMPEKFDLVITDMTMPNLRGDQLAKKIMEVRPDIPVILCTGFSSMIDEKKARKMGVRAFVFKPFLKHEMAKTIRIVLDEAKGSTLE